MPHQTGGLTEALKAHLQAPSLAPLWLALRRRLDRDPTLSGTVTVDLDVDGANRLSSLLGDQVPSGTIRVPLEELDEALRGSSANRGLVDLVTELTGVPSTDFAAPSRPRSNDSADWSIVWAQLDSQLERAGLSGRTWAQSWASWLQRSGILGQAGVVAAAQSVGHATSALELLERTGALDPTQPVRTDQPEWELEQLAERITHNAGGFSEGTLTATLILRAAAFAYDEPAPRTAAERRRWWRRLGVRPDQLTDPVFLWKVRPLGRDRWSTMMRERADLGVVTALTPHERRLAEGARYARSGEVVFVCETPEILQAAVDAETDATLICMSGGSAVGQDLVRDLLVAGANVCYHGDFDWPGVSVAGRLFGVGVMPWRYGANDYLAGVRQVPQDARQPLIGDAVDTPWDDDLVGAMVRQNVLVPELVVARDLLADMGASDRR